MNYSRSDADESTYRSQSGLAISRCVDDVGKINWERAYVGMHGFMHKHQQILFGCAEKCKDRL